VFVESDASIVILLDCWESTPDDSVQNKTLIDSKIDNIINEVENVIPNVEAVVLTTYESTEALLLRTNPYYSNTYELLYNSQHIQGIKDSYMSTLCQNSILDRAHTHKGILEYKWKCEQYAFFNELQLEYYINHVVPHVRTVYYFGKSWNICVRNRPIGWRSVSQLIKYNHLTNVGLYTKNNCILERNLNTNELYIPNLNLDSDCNFVNENTFELVF